ncbi:MAG: acyl carrier protein [Lachnospiraceae bacterium]|nr:acyl carrier protein [Lachnospiraceae bacterium]
MFEEIKKIIVEQLDVEEGKITLNTSFQDDLGADSLDLMELTMALEEAYGIEIPEADVEKLMTVADVISYIENHKE